MGSDTSGHDLPGVSGYFNPRSPCGERRSGRSRPRLTASISIHAPRVGSDRGWNHHLCYLRISIHAPRVGSDADLRHAEFPGLHISIHAPRVGSDPPGWICMRATCISIHAPRVGSDPIRTCPLLLPGQISIHAPRVGSDNRNHWRGSFVTDFNPRSPCGERLAVATRRLPGATISIHAPRVGSDWRLRCCGCTRTISIHAPRVGSDRLSPPWVAVLLNFNPRSPCGERLWN